MNTYLLLDVSAIAYRSFYVMGGLSYQGNDTGVIYGVFREIDRLQKRYPDGKIVFCFDGGSGKRKASSSEYKANRRTDLEDAEKVIAKCNLREQLKQLRKSYLHAAGFRNIFYQKGYEADDLIASFCRDCKKIKSVDKAVIITSDQDLWQLLRTNRVVWQNASTGEIITATDFKEKWKIPPNKWADVKAIAGCSSDNVTGLRGVGEKTAAKYLVGELSTKTKAFQAIQSNTRLYFDNLMLTKLPFKGTITVRDKLVDDCITQSTWNKVMRALGIRSLIR